MCVLSRSFRRASRDWGGLLLLCVSSIVAVAAPASAQSADDMVFRRVWASSVEVSPFLGHVPAEGRHLAFADWGSASGGDLALIDLQTGEVTRLTDKNARGDLYDFTMSQVFSADGEHVAFDWLHVEGVDRFEQQLRVIGRDGSAERVLISEPGPYWIEPMAWTPDGEWVVAQRRSDPSQPLELVLVSAGDGTQRLVQRFDVRALGRLFVSPDGRYAAYDLTLDDSGNSDIHVLDLRSGVSDRLVSGNGDDRLMGWHPDGSGIFFHSNRELGGGIWRLAVTEGRPAGDPELVRSDVWDMVPLGFRGDRFFYRVDRASAQIRTATVDVEAGEVVVPPAMIREPSEGWSRNPAWSPDGRYFAFLDYAGGQSPMAARARLAVRSVYTGDSRFLDFPFPGFPGLQWAADASALLVVGEHGGVRGIHRLDLQTGDVTLLREAPEQGPSSRLALSPDGSTYYVHRNEGEVWAGDVATGRERLVAHVPGVRRGIGVSPDGSMLAMLTGDFGGENGLLVMPAEGGEPREIYRGEGIFGGGPFLHMTPDNRWVLAASFQAPGSIWRFAVDGREEPLQLLSGEAPRGFTMSPDGRHVAYWEWPDPEGATELWVIEGLLGAR